jgi:hypothetical protein
MGKYNNLRPSQRRLAKEEGTFTPSIRASSSDVALRNLSYIAQRYNKPYSETFFKRTRSGRPRPAYNQIIASPIWDTLQIQSGIFMFLIHARPQAVARTLSLQGTAEFEHHKYDPELPSFLLAHHVSIQAACANGLNPYPCYTVFIV